MHCPELRVVGEVFRNNSDVLLRLLALPLTLLTIGETRKDGVLFLAEALILNRQKWADDDSDAVNLEIRREAVRRHEQMAKTDPNFNAVSNAKAILAELLREDTIKRPLEALLYAAAMYAWAAVECAVKDVWAIAINLRPKELGHRALLGVPAELASGGISSKQISVGLLAKHDFDLRGKIGTILAEKYDFTGVEGMRQAYSAAFGKQATIEAAFSSDRLSELEAVRHLVAHRAGVVDEEFLRRTKRGDSIGQPVALGGTILPDLVNAAIACTTSLLRFVDGSMREP
jgi:hypothetical protein